MNKQKLILLFITSTGSILGYNISKRLDSINNICLNIIKLNQENNK